MVLVAAAPHNDYLVAITLIKRLRADLLAKQTKLKISTKTMAAQMNLPSSTLSDLLAGKTPSQATILAAFAWLAKH